MLNSITIMFKRTACAWITYNVTRAKMSNYFSVDCGTTVMEDATAEAT